MRYGDQRLSGQAVGALVAGERADGALGLIDSGSVSLSDRLGAGAVGWGSSKG